MEIISLSKNVVLLKTKYRFTKKKKSLGLYVLNILSLFAHVKELCRVYFKHYVKVPSMITVDT